MFKFRLRAYLSVHAFHVFGNTSLLFLSYFTLSNAMEITSPQCAWTKELELVFTCTLTLLFEKSLFSEGHSFSRDWFLRGVIFADVDFAIFCLLRWFISNDVCSVIIVAKRQKRNLCKLSKELKPELRKVTLFMRDLSAANQTAIISFLRTLLFVFMIRLGSNVNWVVVWGGDGGMLGGYWLYNVGGKSFILRLTYSYK